MLVAPGEELIAETNSHLFAQNLAQRRCLVALQHVHFPAKNGLLKAADALDIARPNSGPYLVSTTAIAVENTHNFGGGTVQPISENCSPSKRGG
jgi:threonine aldolase